MKKHTIIGISGRQGSGKSTLAAALVKKYSGIHMKFATPLYEMHEAVRGVLEKYGCHNMAKKEGDLLQYLGTEFGRKKLGVNIWADLTHNAIMDTIYKLIEWDDKAFIVVDDTRFENELDMFIKLRDVELDDFHCKVITVRLEADEATRKSRAEGWRDNVNHSSETGLDHRVGDFDLVINTAEDSAEIALLRVINLIEPV